VLSIAAGIRLSDLARWLQNQGAGYAMVRAMPNTPALVGSGMTGLYSSSMLNEKQRSSVEEVMRATGAFVWINSEEDMDAVTAISGSGPAYFFYFIEALEQAGKELGLPEQTARKLALETAFGAAKLARESTEDPATLRARVTSKKGTTECALLSMEERIADSVKQRIITAAKAAAARSREMGDELGKAS
jgi:pyrroline-5-carboxylate reductase